MRPIASRWKAWIFRSIVVLFPLLVLAAIEFSLRLADFGYPTAFLVPDATASDLLTDNYKFAWRFFPKPLARASQPIRTSRRTPDEVTRIVVLGGSAAMGDPEPAFGMPRQLQALLEARHPHRRFEVINAAVTAINSHVVLSIADDCRQLDADAWVIYMGNNEVHGPFGAGTIFNIGRPSRQMIRTGLAFRASKFGQWIESWRTPQNDTAPNEWGGMEMFLEHQVTLDDPDLERVYANLQGNLRAMLNLARRSATPVVLSTVATNLSDSPPFVSVNAPLDASLWAKWSSEFQSGVDAQLAGDIEPALGHFDRAMAIDATHAELQYRTAQCWQSLGDSLSAARHFQLARDYDALRFRADSRINRIIRDQADSFPNHVTLVDATTKFADAARNETTASPVPASPLPASPLPASALPSSPVPGAEFFYEHVHFNFHGNYWLARWIAEALEPTWDSENATDSWLTEAAVADRLGYSPYHERLVVQEVIRRLRQPPFSGQIDGPLRSELLTNKLREISNRLTPSVASQYVEKLETAIEQWPHDWMLRRNFAMLLESMGQLEQSEAQLAKIVDDLPHHPEPHFDLGAILNRLKKWKAAEGSLRRALELRPDFARAENSLGIALSHQERFDEAYAAFARSTALQPSFAEAFFKWGQVLAFQGDSDQSIQKYYQAVQADRDYLEAHLSLKDHFVQKKDFSKALPHVQAIARLAPQQAAAHLNLGLLYLNLKGREQDAAESLQRALELDPNNAIALQLLQSLSDRLPSATPNSTQP